MVRAAQITVVLVVAALAWLLLLRYFPAGPLAVVIGLIALVVIIQILFRPVSRDSWEDFWENLASRIWWW